MNIQNSALLQLLGMNQEGDLRLGKETLPLQGEGSEDFKELLSSLKFQEDLLAGPQVGGDKEINSKLLESLSMDLGQGDLENLTNKDIIKNNFGSKDLSSILGLSNNNSQIDEILLSKTNSSKAVNPESVSYVEGNLKNTKAPLESILNLDDSKNAQFGSAVENSQLNKKLKKLKEGLNSFKNIEEVMINKDTQKLSKVSPSNRQVLNSYLSNESEPQLFNKSYSSENFKSININENGSAEIEKSNQDILSEMNFVGKKGSGEITTLKNSSKVLDLSSIKTGDTNEIINTISEYVAKTSFESKQSLDLIVKHDSLGEFSINVNKNNKVNNIAIEIATKTDNGHKFFIENEAGLAKALASSGIKFGSLKIVSGGESQSFGNFNDSSDSKESLGQSFGKGGQHFGSEKERQDNDSQRRSELWDELRERMGA